jgi:HPt (histidine-containing phosphotransfer) domain-containing protein
MARLKQRRQRQPAPDPHIFDLAHLRRYTQGNGELEAELLKLFNDQLSGLMRQIREGPAAGDWKLAVHTLKGSARAIGAPAIGDIAARIEDAGYSAASETKSNLFDLVERAIADFVKEAKKLAP